MGHATIPATHLHLPDQLTLFFLEMKRSHLYNLPSIQGTHLTLVCPYTRFRKKQMRSGSPSENEVSKEAILKPRSCRNFQVK
ncbi:hypothetical protein B5X24_HaOG202996 [Helicoverpa armigera]|uniref:Uncharacterized protein n=1 Tax=Helicoverpa armigera TaxID=29058 RepID=A0A2W1BRN5_HELAM|nr:hypothetical protein B5X24_HaOG202996 [Helicoverpa armigera]